MIRTTIIVVGHTDIEAHGMKARLKLIPNAYTTIKCLSFASLHRGNFYCLEGLPSVILIASMGIALPSTVTRGVVHKVWYNDLLDGTCVSTCAACNTCLCIRSKVRDLEPPPQYQIDLSAFPFGLTPYDEDIKDD